MAKQLTFQIPDDKYDLFIDAWSEGYQTEIDGEPNPETKPQFAKKIVVRTLHDRVRAFESAKVPEIGIT